MSLSIIGIVSDVVKGIVDIGKKFIVDKDKRLEFESELQTKGVDLISRAIEKQAEIIVAEASGESWLQRNWRPVLMLWFAGLVGAHWLGITPPNLPEAVVINLLDIVQIGIGGYIIGRSAEKGIKAWKEKDK